LKQRTGRGESFFAGTLAGLEVWIWFALSEYIFATLVPLLNRDHGMLGARQWRGLAIVFACYAAAGIVSGLLGAVVSRWTGYDLKWRLRAVLLGPAILFVLNALVAQSPAVQRCAVAGAGIAVASALWWSTSHKDWQTGLGTSAAISGAALNFAAWIPSLGDRRLSGPLLLAILPGAAILLMGIGGLLVRRPASAPRHRPAASFGTLLAALLVLFSGSAVVSSRAERFPNYLPDAGTSAAGRPNVLLIAMDTVRADHLAVYGYSRNTTPHLRDFARQAVLYKNPIAVAPHTLPSHASIFTGLYPQSHGAHHSFPDFPQGRPLATAFPTLASVLTSEGYQTMAVMANRYFLRPQFGIARGFQFADWQQPVETLNGSMQFFLRMRIWELLPEGAWTRILDARTITADEVNSRAFLLLQQMRARRAPFFLFLNYMDAHVPFLPPAPYGQLYPGSGSARSIEDYEQPVRDVDVSGLPMDAHLREYLISQYDGGIAYLDQKLFELLDFLKQNGQYEHTMIVLTSDHGEAFGDKNIVGHGASVYQDQVHVPLLVKYPHQQNAETVDALVSQVDLMPTILQVAGVSVPDGLEGKSLLNPKLLGARPVVAEFHGVNNLGPRFVCCRLALLSGTRKLIYSTHGAPEVYDISSDPGETRDLYGPDDPVSAALRNELTEWSRRTSPRYLTTQGPDRESIERLKSLGYARQK
jgi:arylsulfatase A-like enzyme